MKVVCSVFVAIFLYIYTGCNSLEAKSAVSKQSAFFQVETNVIKETVYFSNTQLNHTDTSKKTPTKHKKRNKKGVNPLLLSSISSIDFHPGINSNGGILFKQIAYCFFSFSGNGKRGPPPC